MFSANTENGPVTPRIVRGCREKLLVSERAVSTTQVYEQTENYATQTSTKDNLYCAICHSCEYIQIACKGDTGQNVREEHIHRAGKN